MKINDGRFIKGQSYEERYGIEKAREVKNNKSIKMKGNKFNFRGGTFKNSNGYILVLSKNHPNGDVKGYVPKHRLVMEQKIERYLEQEEIVHHINEVRDDNRIENLELTNRKEHMRHHKTKGGDVSSQKLSENWKF